MQDELNEALYSAIQVSVAAAIKIEAGYYDLVSMIEDLPDLEDMPAPEYGAATVRPRAA